jgi:uncharacterized iron-regulated membrane protein
MEPQQPGQLGHNPYDFILNPPKPPAQHPIGGKLPLPKIGGNSLGLQIGILIGGAVLIMIVIGIIVSALTGSKLNTKDLTNLAAQQTEIVTVATQGNNLVTQSANQQVAINARLTIATDNRNLIGFLLSHGVKVSTKQLQADVSAATTLQLRNAQANSTIDPVFAQIMQSKLQTYASSVKTDYNGATSTTLKQLLSGEYAQAELLLREIPTSLSGQN